MHDEGRKSTRGSAQTARLYDSRASCQTKFRRSTRSSTNASTPSRFDASNPPPTFGHVYKSDPGLSLDCKKYLQHAVAAFEPSISEDQKDWHLKNDETVTVLVHPSSVLSCPDGLTIVSRAVERVQPRILDASNAPIWICSQQFQRLPCEVGIEG